MEITSFAGTAINGSTGIVVRYGYGNWAPNQATTQFRERVDQSPEFLSVSYPAKQQGFEVHIGDAYTGTTDEFMLTVNALFSVRAGEQTLIFQRVAGDASTEMHIQARVVSFGRVHNNQWRGTFEIADPVGQSTAESTATTSPTINDGGLAVTPKIVLSGGLAATRNRATITDRTGQGIANYPVRIDYTSGLDPSNIIVYVSGVKAPFWYDSTSGALWVRVNCGPNESTYVDIYHGAFIANTKTANTLDMAGLAKDISTNSLPGWDDWAISSHPQAAALAWVPVNMPDRIVSSSGSTHPWTYTLAAQNSESVTFVVRAQASIDANDWNGLLLTLPVPLASGATIAIAMTYTTWVLDMGSARNVTRLLLGRTRENAPWEIIVSDEPTADMIAASTTYDFDLPATDVSGHVQLAIVFGTSLAILGDSQPKAVFEISDVTLTAGLNPTQIPSISLSAAIAAQLIDGTLLNSTTGDKIVFDTLLCDDVDFTLDRVAGTIGPASGPWYSDNVEFTNSSRWFTLAAGSNTWTCDTGAVALSWHERTVTS